MKYLRIFLILLLIPFIVLAEECDISKITITSMKPNKIEGNTEVISDPTFEDRTIILNLKMYDVNDSITYDMTIKNDSEEDYMIDEDAFKTDSDYIEYTLKTKDNTNVVKANSTKEVSLIVTYKKEVDDSLLTNNKFNASNSLKLSLNTSEKEQPLDIITTDNIKESLNPEEVKNPVTSVSSIRLLSFVLLTTIIIVCLNMKYKKRYGKFFLLIMSLSLISTVYAICKVDVEVNSVIEIEKKPKLFDTVTNLAKEENACVTKYDGDVTDEVGKTVTATKVYFDKCADQRNVIFGGFCWQVIRTTETGGTKMIYNGEPIDGKCESTRSDHKGVSMSQVVESITDGNYLYGTSYSYDETTNTFSLIDTKNVSLLSSPVEEVIHKYTCFGYDNTQCQYLYFVEDLYSNTKLIYKYLKGEDLKYSVIGRTRYNQIRGLSEVGYMYNQKYTIDSFHNNLNGYKYSDDFIYDSVTNTYTLTGTVSTQKFFTIFSHDNNAHYTCFNTEGSCQEIYYVHSSWGNGANYYTLSNGESIDDVLYNELDADDVNKKDSYNKFLIDMWYEHNLSEYTNRIEDTVYCNNREISYLAGFDPHGSKEKILQFINDSYDYSTSSIDLNNVRKELSCSRNLDQFSMSNTKAKLKYPIGLPTMEELFNLGIDEESNNLRTAGVEYSTMTPMAYEMIGLVGIDGELKRRVADIDSGVRPTISLKPGVTIINGTGSEEEPWIIK